MKMTSPNISTNSIVSEYDILEVVGKGQYGVCRKGIRRIDGKEVAIKSISKMKIISEQDQKEVEREIAIMRHLAGHPNIVQIFNVFEDKSYIHIVMELCKGGELFDQIINKGHYSEKEAAGLVRTMLNVIQHMHVLGVVHRDLKPENFLICLENPDKPSIKAIDFGLSAFISQNEKLKECVGSSYYIAPEVLRRSYGPDADIWSAGVILYILLCGSPPFFGSNDREILQKVMKYRDGTLNFKFQPWPTISDGAKKCVQMMLKLDPGERASIETILNHPWMKENGTASERPISNEVISRLQSFVKMNKLQRMVSRMMAEMLSPAEIQGLNTIFERLDADKDGVITVEELRDGLSNWGVKNENLETEVEKLMLNLDMDSSGSIDLEEFMSATMSLCQLETEGHLMQAFTQIDTDGNGVITREELGDALKKFGLLESEHSIDEVLDEVDENRDGFIDYNEFVASLRKGKLLKLGSMQEFSRWSSDQDSGNDAGNRKSSRSVREWNSRRNMDVDYS